MAVSLHRGGELLAAYNQIFIIIIDDLKNEK
jgi:hypothetical protein